MIIHKFFLFTFFATLFWSFNIIQAQPNLAELSKKLLEKQNSKALEELRTLDKNTQKKLVPELLKAIKQKNKKVQSKETFLNLLKEQNIPLVLSDRPSNKKLPEIKVAQVTASSQYPTDASSYYPHYTTDNNVKTAWFPTRSPEGEWIKWTFSEKCFIHSMKIVNGWLKSDFLWDANSRQQVAKLTFSDGSSQLILLEDHKKWQEIPIAKSTKFVQFSILTTYQGSFFSESGIAEVKFYPLYL